MIHLRSRARGRLISPVRPKGQTPQSNKAWCDNERMDRGDRLEWSAADPGRVWINLSGESRCALPALSTDEHGGGGGIHCEQWVERRTAVGRAERGVAVHRAIHPAAAPLGGP